MHDAWLERWRIGRTGWHEPGGNRNLKRYWTFSGRRVLVPLCGKTPDLLWIESQGNEVVGIELSEIAVQAFFDENALDYERVDGSLTAYRARELELTLYCGDFFEFREMPFDVHYDRGALSAIAPDQRSRYARHVASLLSDDAQQFVITLEYDQSVCDGPPYSVGAGDLLDLWPALRRHASVDDIANAPPKFLAQGLEELREVVWVTA
jgi:thiopurine S-methyltransferase